MNRNRVVLLGVLIGLMGIVALWARSDMLAAKSAAINAGKDLVECRRMTASIESFRKRPARASERVQLASETTGLIEKSARGASIELRNLIRITPQPARRVGDSVYKEKSALVHLKNITLKQLVEMVHHLVTTRRGLHVNAIRMTAPQPNDTGSWWAVELAVTYLIYDPPKTRRQENAQ